MQIVNVNEDNIKLFSKVLTDSAKWLDSIGQSMWKVKNLSPAELLKNYDITEMKLCYEDEKLVGVYILQFYDPLFWSELKKNETGVIHKLAVSGDCRKQGYGRQIIESAELLCRKQGIKSLRLNCGTFRSRLRNFYESVGFEMVDRVFIDNRDQIRYYKELTE